MRITVAETTVAPEPPAAILIAPVPADASAPPIAAPIAILAAQAGPGLPRKTISAALDGVEQGVVVFNARSTVVLANRFARSMLQLHDMELGGRALAEVLSEAPALDADTARALAARCDAPEPCGGEMTLPIGVVARVRRLVGRHRALFLDPAVKLGRSEGDALTGLADRRGLLDGLHSALQLAPAASGLALFALDLGRFKQVNDGLGHALGDMLLQQAAARLRGTLRRHDLAARLGGDEFAVIAAIGSDPDDASALARRMVALLDQPYRLDGHDVHVEARAGIALAPEHGTAPDLLMRRALLALRQARLDAHEVRVFDPVLQTRAEARRGLESDLRRALALGQFELHYQPIVSLACGGVSGFEALIRWRHPVRGLVPPNDFIPLAEEIGMISAIGDWVMREACREAATWPAPLAVSVNASGAQLEGGRLVSVARDALAGSGLDGGRLQVEVTESTLLRRGPETLDALRALRAMGASIAMDDFGTGYSSLTQLQSFPFDKLKIDRSFVSRIGEAGNDGLAIVRAIARMGSSLGLRTVAEGVETAEQREALRAEGCDEAQGYLMSRPVPAAQIPGLLRHLGVAETAPTG